MRKALISAIGVSCAAAAFAVGDIPTRYTGSFPSVGTLSSITGTFAGNRLTLKAARIRGTNIVKVSGTFSCTRASSTQTRCPGAFKADGGKDVDHPAVLSITWSGGQPVAMTK
jgi:hypothetical protein